MKKKYMAPLMEMKEIQIPAYLQETSQGHDDSGGTNEDPDDAAKERKTGLWGDSENGGSLW